MSEVLTAPVTTASTGGSATTCVRGIPKSQKAFDLLMCAGEEPALAQAEAEQHSRSAASTISWAHGAFISVFCSLAVMACMTHSNVFHAV